ncbi:unnamed protein product, partial [Meganyctiphanes norvegica]
MNNKKIQMNKQGIDLHSCSLLLPVTQKTTKKLGASKIHEKSVIQYTPTTWPVSSDNNACERGCRFYTIGSFVSDGLPDKTEDHGNGIEDIVQSKVKKLCYGSCVEAYNETSSLTDACKFGCDAQEQVSKMEIEKDEEEQTMHLLSPIMQVRAVYSTMMGALRVFRTSVVTYFISDDNKIVAIESEPEIIMEVAAVPVDDAQETAPLQARNLEREMFEDSGSDPSVVSCFSRRMGVPRYLLVASVMALICFTIYIICAVCSTAESSKHKGLSVQADPIVSMPVKCVRPEDLTKLSLIEEDDLQAPPLPIKVNL